MIPADRWIEHLRTHVDVARLGEDPEGIHQVRVASRRLDVWLRLSGRRMLRDDIRWLRHGLAGARDLDVLLTHDLPVAARAWLVQRRADEQAHVVALLDDERTEAILGGLATLPALDPVDARNHVPDVLRQVLHRGGAVDEAPNDPEKLHALRRSLRTTRYALEWLGAPNQQTVRLQDAFGESNDRAVLLAWLDKRADDSEAAWRAELRGDAVIMRATVVQTWRETQPEVEALLTSWTSM
jgi:CHAD domain-containing protein